jgi:hypothetical protein
MAAAALAEAGVLDTGVEPVQPGPDGEALDINVLKRLIGDEPASLHALFEDFLGTVSAGLATIKGTAVADDLGEIRSIVHRLKSSARSQSALGSELECIWMRRR